VAFIKQKIEWKQLDMNKLPKELGRQCSEAIAALQLSETKVKAVKDAVTAKLGSKVPAGKSLRVALTIGWNGQPRLSVGLADASASGGSKVEAESIDGFSF